MPSFRGFFAWSSAAKIGASSRLAPRIPAANVLTMRTSGVLLGTLRARVRKCTRAMLPGAKVADMSAATPIPLEEYLHTSYSPDREYRDGVLIERNVGENPHSE